MDLSRERGAGRDGRMPRFLESLRALTWGGALAASLGMAAAVTRGAEHEPVPDAWLGWLDVDPLALAGVVAREGDDAVLRRLAPGVDPAVCLSAVAGTRFLASPELALVDLAALAAGRDPDLSEAAARRSRDIAQGLALTGLARRELTADSLGPARRALADAAGQLGGRADIREFTAEAALLLGSIGVPLAQRAVP